METTQDRIRVGTLSDLDDDKRLKVSHGGIEIVVLSWRGQLHAFENKCVHEGGPVGEGIVIGCVKPLLDDQQRHLGDYFDDSEPHLVCPWHGWEYDLQTGEAVGSRDLSVRKYEVQVEGDEVHVCL